MFMEDAILTEDTDQRRIEHVVSLKFDIILCHVSCINPLDGRLLPSYVWTAMAELHIMGYYWRKVRIYLFS